MDFIKKIQKKIDIDNDLSNRYIDLDPVSYTHLTLPTNREV